MNGNNDLSPRTNWIDETAPYRHRVEELQKKTNYLDSAYAGLKDLDIQFDLINAELTLVSVIVKIHGFQSSLDMKQAAREYALDALDRIEEITVETISLDQKPRVIKSTELEQARSLLKEIILFGGVDLFRAPDSLGRRSKRIVKSVERALYKFIEPVDASIVIEEGEEDVYISDYLLLPRSQAVLMIEEELIPLCEAQLAENPGDPEIQKRLEVLFEQEELLEKMRFFPRARPVLMHESVNMTSNDFIQFAANGEMLVKMKMQTILGSGNKFDLFLENMKFQIVRDIAGRSIGPESGKPPIPVNKLFRSLSHHFPFLRRLEQKEELKRLAHMVKTGRREDVRTELLKMMVNDRDLLWTAKPLKLSEFD